MDTGYRLPVKSIHVYMLLTCSTLYLENDLNCVHKVAGFIPKIMLKFLWTEEDSAH